MSHLYDIAVFIVVLGELIFFHEMGHFLAAKACGIYCERFSLGMPPRLFGIKFGETDYCIGLLPIGGYVKMAGQEDVPLSDEERKEQYGSIPPERWFSSKPVWQRIIVIAAGPFMNLVLAVLLYASVAAVGADVPETKYDNRIGVVAADSPAAQATMYKIASNGQQPDMTGEPDAVGWRTGDRILSINGEPVTNITDVAINAILSGGKPMRVELERTGESGQVTRYVSEVTPVRKDDSDHPQFGVAPFQTALVDRVMEGMPASAAGLQHGDIITRVNGQIVDSQEFSKVISSRTDGQPVQLEVLRNGETLHLTITPTVVGRIEDVQFKPPLQWSLGLPGDKPLQVAYDDEKFLAATGLQKDDTLKEIDGKPATPELLRAFHMKGEAGPFAVTVERSGGLLRSAKTFTRTLKMDELRQAIAPFDLQEKPVIADLTPELESSKKLLRNDIVEKVDGQPATIALLREAEEHPNTTVKLTVRTPSVGYGVFREESEREVDLPVAAIGQVGVTWMTKMVFHRATPGQVIPEALGATRKSLDTTLMILGRLVSGGLSVKEVGGPVQIFQITTQAARVGLSWLMEITALISINLAIFNLLPLPVLDGGHLMFLCIEGVRRKPVSARVMEWVQQAGLVLIIALMLFVTYNDVKRVFIQTFMP